MHSKQAALVALLRHLSSPLANRDDVEADPAANSDEANWRELVAH